jgi:hypothetical protein
MSVVGNPLRRIARELSVAFVDLPPFRPRKIRGKIEKRGVHEPMDRGATKVRVIVPVSMRSETVRGDSFRDSPGT